MTFLDDSVRAGWRKTGELVAFAHYAEVSALVNDAIIAPDVPRPMAKGSEAIGELVVCVDGPLMLAESRSSRSVRWAEYDCDHEGISELLLKNLFRRLCEYTDNREYCIRTIVGDRPWDPK